MRKHFNNTMNKKERINGRKLNRLQTDCDMGFSKTVRPQSLFAPFVAFNYNAPGTYLLVTKLLVSPFRSMEVISLLTLRIIASIWQNLKHRLNLDSTIPLNFSTGTGNCLPASGRSAIRELDCEQSLFCSKIRGEERHWRQRTYKLDMQSREPQVARASLVYWGLGYSLLVRSPHTCHARTLTCFAFFLTDFRRQERQKIDCSQSIRVSF